MAETSFMTVFLPVMVALRLQVLCVYNPSPNSGSGCSVCFISCCTISSVAQCLCWESEGQGRGRALVWWGNAARLHDSAFYLAKAITKTQLSPFCAQSLSCSLTRSAVWNMLIPQAGLFGASNSHKNIICCCPLSLAQLGALGCSCFPQCLALWAAAAFPGAWLCFFLSSLSHVRKVRCLLMLCCTDPSDVLVCRLGAIFGGI